MKLPEVLKGLQTIEEPTKITLSPGPFIANCDWHDAIAAKLLSWLYDEMPENATHGDLDDVLLAALWWIQFLTMQPKIGRAGNDEWGNAKTTKADEKGCNV